MQFSTRHVTVSLNDEIAGAEINALKIYAKTRRTQS